MRATILEGAGWEHRPQDGGVLQQVPPGLLEQVGEPCTSEAKSMLRDRLHRIQLLGGGGMEYIPSDL